MNIISHSILMAFSTDRISIIAVLLMVIVLVVVLIVNRITQLHIRKSAERSNDLMTIMRQSLYRSNTYVVRYSVLKKKLYNMHGHFLPYDDMDLEQLQEHVHPDDYPVLYENMRSIVYERTTMNLTVRWNWKTKAETPEWHFLHIIGIGEYNNPLQAVPTNVFCTLTDETDSIMQEQEDIELSSRYRMIFDQDLMGLAFADKDGNLLTVNKKMMEIMKFKTPEDPYFFNKKIYELPNVRGVFSSHEFMDVWFCSKFVLHERNINTHLELRIHPIRDHKGNVLYITISARDINEERNLYIKNKLNEESIRKTNETVQAYEMELQYLMDSVDMNYFRASFETNELIIFKSKNHPEVHLPIEKLRDLYATDRTFREDVQDHRKFFSEPRSSLVHMKSILHPNEGLQWNIINSLPSYDEKGNLVGCYGVVQNTTEFITKQEKLKEETERANQSGLRKSTFMANMTHEIRTPLNAIVGFSDVLSMLSTPEEKKEIINVIMNNCDMLLRLIQDLQAVSALDVEGMKINPTKINFSKVFNGIASSLAQRIQEPDVQFIADNPLDAYYTTLDSERIQQIYTNFVTNAVKYTKHGHIKIGYAPREMDGKAGLYFYCEDTGTGIPKESQEKIFDRFVKLNDYVQGTGLGLNICKTITDSCHGHIGVESEGNGTGSTFWAWIPCEEIKNAA